MWSVDCHCPKLFLYREVPCVNIFYTSPATLGPSRVVTVDSVTKEKVLRLEKSFRRKRSFILKRSPRLLIDSSSDSLRLLRHTLQCECVSVVADYADAVADKGQRRQSPWDNQVQSEHFIFIAHTDDAGVMAQWHASVHRHFWSFLCALVVPRNSNFIAFIHLLSLFHLVSSQWSYLSVGSVAWLAFFLVFARPQHMLFHFSISCTQWHNQSLSH